MRSLLEKVTGKWINYGPGNPLMVAEISGNHGGDLDVARDLIGAASAAGFDAVKFQYFRPETMASRIPNDHHRVTWKGERRYLSELYRAVRTPLEWFPELFSHARASGLIPFASLFDPIDVPWFDSQFGPALYKVASAECLWTDLVRACVGTGADVFVSDGHMLGQGLDYGDSVIPMRCVADYPADPLQYAFGDLRADVIWGVSDHTSGSDEVSLVAAAAGASVIEFHLAVGPCEDSEFSLDIADAAVRVMSTRRAAGIRFGPPVERSVKFARRWVATEDIAEGELVADSAVLYRCSEGIEADSGISGLLADRKIRAGEPISWEDLK